MAIFTFDYRPETPTIYVSIIKCYLQKKLSINTLTELTDDNPDDVSQEEELLGMSAPINQYWEKHKHIFFAR